MTLMDETTRYIPTTSDPSQVHGNGERNTGCNGREKTRTGLQAHPPPLDPTGDRANLSESETGLPYPQRSPRTSGRDLQIPNPATKTVGTTSSLRMTPGSPLLVLDSLSSCGQNGVDWVRSGKTRMFLRQQISVPCMVFMITAGIPRVPRLTVHAPSLMWPPISPYGLRQTHRRTRSVSVTRSLSVCLSLSLCLCL